MVNSESDGQHTVYNYDRLTPSQQEKYNYLADVYNDEARTCELIHLLDGRGRNSWSSVNAKITALENATAQIQQYNETIAERINLHKSYSPSMIVNIIGEVRRELALPPYLSSIKSSCERDFFSLFIVKNDKIEGLDGKSHNNYIPVFRL